MENSPRPERAVDLTERLLQAAVIAIALLSLLAAQMVPREIPENSPAGPAGELELLGRYTLGVGSLLSSFDPGGAQLDELVTSAGRGALTPVDRLRQVPLLEALGRSEDADARLEAVRREVLDLSEEAQDLAALEEDLRAFEAALARRRGLERPGGAAPPLEEDARQRLTDGHGWYGELAVALAEGGEDRLVAGARRLALGLVIGSVGALAAFAIGCGLAFLAWMWWRSGRLRSGYRGLLEGSEAASRRPYLESLLLFIVALQVLGAASGALMAGGGGRWPLLLNWLALLALIWPLQRGVSRDELGLALGWPPGASPWREIGAGIVGYLASAPLLALGFSMTVLIARFGDQQPYHPIVDWVKSSSTLDLLIVVSAAVLWAPIVEENVFRGAFFHYLRERLGPLASATLVAITFAALHPQGLAGLPFLIALAIALALIREWRGSLIAPITVHMIHNGLILALLLLVSS
ncbi:MAG: CPBP family intramembrane glutamic endopeptidase [Acidobacteriota bacterium]